jgi:putative flippase GtrA
MRSRFTSAWAAAVFRREDLVGQSVRFASAGGLVACTYVAITTGLSQLAHVPFQLALAIGLVCAVSLHFALQRLFVWRGDADYALSVHGQLWRYLAIVAVQYGLTASATAILPTALGVPVIAVYLVVTALITVGNFVIFRGRIFHPSSD